VVEERAAAAAEEQQYPLQEPEPESCAPGAAVVLERMVQVVAPQTIVAAQATAPAPPSPVMEELEEPGEARLQPPRPRKLKVCADGWTSDDTKVFDIDREKHTHTHSSKYLQVS
jgi:hypothetical protein